MGSFRAKDADRDRFVELIEAAYVDGQLGTEDRELRITRALSAETLDELESLTRDLQLPAGYVAPPPPAARTVPPRRLVAMIVASGAVVALLGVGVASVVLVAGTETDSATSSEVAQATEAHTAVQSEPAAEEPPAPFEMTAGQVRRFLRAYEKKFGTLDAWEVGFHADRVGVQVPASRVRKRFERWSWDGSWRQDSEASAVIGQQKFVSLGPLDVNRMFDNITRAKRTLDVPHGKLTHVLVNDWGAGPSVNIYIANSFDESGYLKTTLSGDVIGRYPYAS